MPVAPRLPPLTETAGRQAGSEETDRWGCHWIYPLESLDGLCVKHPVASWADLQSYRPPNPDEFTDWEQARKNAARAKAEERISSGGTGRLPMGRS